MEQEFIKGKGFKLIEGGISIMSLAEAHVKKGKKLPNPLSFAINVLQLIRSLDPDNNTQDKVTLENNPRIFSIQDFKEIDDEYLFKYISEDSWRFYLKNSIRLGTISDYQTIENEQARDVFEGYTVINTQTKERDVYSTVIGGFNHYIFCTTDNGGKITPIPDMEDKFGKVLLRVSWKPLVEKICKLIGARSYKAHQVVYSNAKLFNAGSLNVTIEEKVMFNPILFTSLVNSSFLPCLFIKPTEFNPEHETRITFEMANDVKEPENIIVPDLNNYIERMN